MNGAWQQVDPVGAHTDVQVREGLFGMLARCRACDKIARATWPRTEFVDVDGLYSVRVGYDAQARAVDRLAHSPCPAAGTP